MCYNTHLFSDVNHFAMVYKKLVTIHFYHCGIVLKQKYYIQNTRIIFIFRFFNFLFESLSNFRSIRVFLAFTTFTLVSVNAHIGIFSSFQTTNACS